MKIATRLNLISLAAILVMTAAVLGAAVFFLGVAGGAGFMGAIGVIAFAALCLNAIAVGLFGRWLLRRIGATLDCVRRIEQGDVSARIDHGGAADEIGALQRSINAMGECIGQRAREQIETQEALRASEARVRRVVESSMIGVFFWDTTGAITEANDAFLEIIGYARDDLHAVFSGALSGPWEARIDGVWGILDR